MEEIIKDLIDDEMSQKIIATAEEIARSSGIEQVNVRRLLQTLNITNRVFYNRFHNIEEVLDIIYQRTSLKIRESVSDEFDSSKDFFEQVKDIVANTLVKSYENKENLNQFIFESDSNSDDNYFWWKAEISKIIEYGKEIGALKDIDAEIMSYSIWCFIRGYNADALGRAVPKEIAVENFKYSFGVLLDGMKK